MLQFMGRENGEDYGNEFLVMLNTWEAAVTFRKSVPRGTDETTLDIARFLGACFAAPVSGKVETQFLLSLAHALEPKSWVSCSRRRIASLG